MIEATYFTSYHREEPAAIDIRYRIGGDIDLLIHLDEMIVVKLTNDQRKDLAELLLRYHEENP
jgi:hypothetical protein